MNVYREMSVYVFVCLFFYFFGGGMGDGDGKNGKKNMRKISCVSYVDYVTTQHNKVLKKYAVYNNVITPQ